jgi:hypothetical protein
MRRASERARLVAAAMMLAVVLAAVGVGGTDEAFEDAQAPPDEGPGEGPGGEAHGDYGHANEHSEPEPEEYEYIETPEMASTGTFRSERTTDLAAVQGMRVMIDHPSEGFVYEEDQVTIHVNAENVPAGEKYSGMLYFGSGNPFPIPMDSVPVGITVTDLAPGNYSVKFMLLDADRQPTGVEADVKFERRAPPGFQAPKPDNSKFDSRVFEISQRFILAERADPLQGENPFLDALRALAKDNTECHTCVDGELSEADEVLAQAIPLLMGVKGRDVELALEMLAHCAELGNVNCRFLHLSLAGMHTFTNSVLIHWVMSTAASFTAPSQVCTIGSHSLPIRLRAMTSRSWSTAQHRTSRCSADLHSLSATAMASSPAAGRG